MRAATYPGQVADTTSRRAPLGGASVGVVKWRFNGDTRQGTRLDDGCVDLRP